MHPLEKRALSPQAVRVLSGSAAGTLAGALGGRYLTDNEEDRLRNTLLGGAAGGVLGGLGGQGYHMLRGNPNPFKASLPQLGPGGPQLGRDPIAPALERGPVRTRTMPGPEGRTVLDEILDAGEPLYSDRGPSKPPRRTELDPRTYAVHRGPSNPPRRTELDPRTYAVHRGPSNPPRRTVKDLIQDEYVTRTMPGMGPDLDALRDIELLNKTSALSQVRNQAYKTVLAHYGLKKNP